MAQASHQPGHIVPRPKHRNSLTKTSLLNSQKLAHAYKSTLLCLKAEAPSITDEYFRTHLNVQKILFIIYICAKSPRLFIASYFSSSSALYWLWLLLGHRAVNRDPFILYSRVGARRCMKHEFIKSRTGGQPNHMCSLFKQVILREVTQGCPLSSLTLTASNFLLKNKFIDCHTAG